MRRLLSPLPLFALDGLLREAWFAGRLGVGPLVAAFMNTEDLVDLSPCSYPSILSVKL